MESVVKYPSKVDFGTQYVRRIAATPLKTVALQALVLTIVAGILECYNFHSLRAFTRLPFLVAFAVALTTAVAMRPTENYLLQYACGVFVMTMVGFMMNPRTPLSEIFYTEKVIHVESLGINQHYLRPLNPFLTGLGIPLSNVIANIVFGPAPLHVVPRA